MTADDWKTTSTDRRLPKGRPNKNSAAIKDVILGALSCVGGESLVGKVLPLQLTGTDGGPITLEALLMRGEAKQLEPPPIDGESLAVAADAAGDD
jgi:hypothetical protein